MTLDELPAVLLTVAAGGVAGFVNTVAGGGSVMTLPLLVWLGLSPLEANATNRVGVIAQAVAATRGFHREGVLRRESVRHTAVGMVGAALGALAAVRIDENAFRTVLAVVFALLALHETWKLVRRFRRTAALTPPGSSPGPATGWRRWVAPLAIFLVGFYAGFIQAGVGILMVLALRTFQSEGLLSANAIKVFYTLAFTLVALLVFGVSDHLVYSHGLALAAGGWVGASVAARAASRVDVRWLEAALCLTTWVAAATFADVL